MDIRTFDDLLLRHGPDLGTWPPEWREAGPRFVAANETARARLDGDRRLAELVARSLEVPPQTAAILHGVDRRVAAARQRPPGDRWRDRLEEAAGRWLAPVRLASAAIALACLAMAGGYRLAHGEGGPGTDALFVAIAEGQVAGELTGFLADRDAPNGGL